jgi:hypothetical protein
MNLNYVGSVAQRFMKFRSSLASTEEIELNIFNAISIYVPKSLALANISADSYDEDTVTADSYAVITVTVDNYAKVLAEGGDLLSQWLPVFNDGTNGSVTLYLIVFDDTDFEPVVTATGITWSPLSKAFDDLYFISCFKTLFSTSYDSTDANYHDLALCLSYKCSLESTLSMCLLELKLVVPEGDEDTNDVKILSLTRGDETTHCTTLIGTDTATRRQYFWGYVNLMGGSHTWLIVHNGTYMYPIVLGKWFERTNNSGEFVGNKLQKIRLSGSKVKPTGLPSPLNTDVNLNLDEKWYTNLDAKNVGYFISISDNSENNAELIRDRTVENFPVTAYLMSKWIDYEASMALANYATANETLTDPVLANPATYNYIQRLVQGTINSMASTGRLTNITLKFPPYSLAKKGNSFEGVAVWSAIYVDDFEGVEVSGSIAF